MPYGHIIERIEALHQRNPLQFQSFGFVGKHMLVQLVQEEIHMLLVPVRNGRGWTEGLFGEWDEPHK